ncbi:PREDICTED: taste receptor type 2 member 39-like [Nanorana parkeri]|uniref:taste receptor type 2 member 39-like n=1 Tax=Nanorana parkeri TaxID=125878 RepID=UPI000854FA2B|nr:PREDICTED: taste receptor type 2 member 39-like [Nanorana parkeri]
MCFTILMFINILMKIFWPSSNVTDFSGILTYLTFCSITSCSWLTADLCFFYSIKILQFQSSFLAWMKMKIDRMIPLLIFVAITSSLLESFIALYIFTQGLYKNSTITATDVTSEPYKLRLKFMNVVLAVTSLPLLIAISTTAASAVSLKLHNDRMKRNMGHTNVRDYQSAVQNMACLIVLYALIYLVMVVFGLGIFADQSWGYWMCWMIIFSFSMVQSILLINGNPKLREAWRKMFTFM